MKKSMKDMIIQAEDTAEQLKLIANPYRLMVLCALVEQPRTVTELMDLTGASQTLMSNHLKVLKNADIVDYHREHRNLNYFIKDERMQGLLTALHSIYCTNAE